ncbi:putative protein kinase RLK-Pelle-CrRLK1L-1 family [Helianthus annuus]|nr:putative protein kinase RLK-Pelle-CrRLK1L-1 family [Helianthus annuus]
MYSTTGKADKLPSFTTSQPCLRFSLAEIQSATKNFDEEQILGEGGFAKVYKGQLCIDETSHVVAIKRLNSVSEQGELEFRSEIEAISKLRHRNLVSLIGFCDDNKELILVYEYMPHDTLHHHLHKADAHLNWVQRLEIAIGAGRGLEYLHKGDDTKLRIIHRDVKSSNILLDENWAAMISDFGLSKIVPVDQSISASVKGTFGYLDPEYFYTRKLTWRTDVYAFGVVLFELLSGRLAVDVSRSEEECSLVRWAQKCMKERKLDQLVDPNIRGTISPKCLRRFAQLAGRCLLSDLKERPTMTEIVASLEDLFQLQMKWDSSANSSSTTGFTWKINKFILSSTKDNQDQRKQLLDQFSPTNKKTVASDLKIFTVDDLHCATRGFAEDQYLGVWSYGEVYKGSIDLTTYSPSEKEMPVVIKSLCWNKTVKLEKAKMELDILKEFSHPNLVKLIGYCLSDKQLFLVNEIMPNGNFEDHLISGGIARLPLVTKVKIVVGIARGIVFLHNAMDYVTTYFQFRETSMFRLDRSKILLDEDFTPKLSDCEVAKIAHGHDPYNIRDDNGLVYGDSYLRFKPFQLQSNLDGFTLVLMEVLTGKQISNENEVQMMDDLLLQHEKMSVRHIAKLCFEICNEVDSESMIHTLLEQYDMYIYEAFATATETATAESYLNDHEIKPVGTLEVKLVQARGLTNKRIIGKSNPFAELYIRPLRNNMKTCKVSNNDLNPIWNEYFEFVVEDVSKQHLTVKIYDDEWLQAAKLLGCAQVQLSQLEPGKVKEVWIKLVKDLDLQKDTKDRGKVHLELLYCPYDVESGFTNPFTSNYTTTSLEKVLKSGDTENSELGNKKRTVIIRGMLSITVISAEDLPPTDLLGKADPFVVLTMKKNGMKNSTRVVNENLNPVWNQTFDFIVEDGLHDMLIVEVYDHDTFEKVYMGRCILTLKRVIQEGEYKDCFALDGAKSGKLNLNLKWMAQPIYRDS